MTDNVLLQIDDSVFDPNFMPLDASQFKKRNSSRGVLIHEGKVALLNVTKDGYHKLPGGGFEEGEDLDQAFKRELIEETGCDCEILDHAGIIIETRSKFKLIQTSHVFLAQVKGVPQPPQFDEGEINAGYELEWHDVEEAQRIFENQKTGLYEGSFICLRDKTIFSHYKEKIYSLTSK